MPPQNLSIPPQQQQQHTEQQMSHTLVDHNAGIGISMSDQHSSHSLEHAHSMLDLSETGSSLEHLAGGGHSSQSLAGLSLGRATDHSLDTMAAIDGRRHLQSLHRISALNEGGNQSLRQISNHDRELINRPLSRLGINSLSDRQSQPMRNLTPVRTDSRGGVIAGNMTSDGRGSVGLGSQSMGGSSGNGLQDSGGTNPQTLNFNSEQPPQSLLDSATSVPSLGRPPSMGGAQHNIGSGDQQQHGVQSLPLHLRGLLDHPSHAHQNLVDHHSQQQNMGGDTRSNTHNGRNGLSVFGLDDRNGHLNSRPGSSLLSEANSHNDARDLTRSVYSTSSISDDRVGGHQTTSLIEETIAAVALNLNKSSHGGGIMPGPLPPNALLGLGGLGTARPSSAASQLGHGGDESLVDLVGRHHAHSIPMLLERTSQSLSGLMDENSMNQSPGHSQGKELERAHPCLTCLKLFRSKQQLAQHSLVHTGIRKHVCSFCDRAFKQLSHLQQHVRIHTGEKPYRCKFENCERAFAQLSNLQHHMRNHDDQVKKEATRIHKCQICHRCYTNESSLKSHTLKMHIHIKPVDQHAPPVLKKKRKRKNKDLYGGAPTMVPVTSSSDGAFSGALPGAKASNSRPQSPTSSDDDEIIFVGEQVGLPRVDNFGGAAGSLVGQGQMLQGGGERSVDMSHQIPFSGMGNFSRSADPLALLASANRFTLQENMMSGFGASLNSFSDQLAFRDAALLNSRFGDLRGPSQGTGFDDRFSSNNFNQQQQQPQRDRDGFGSHNDISSRGNGGNGNAGGGSDNMQAHNGSSSESRNQIPAHNQIMLRGAGLGGLGAGIGGMMQGAGQGGLGSLIKQIKQEPLDYFSASCHGGDQFAGMGVGNSRGFLSPQHIISSHLRSQLPSLNVPLIRDHFSHNQMLPHSSSLASSGTSSSPVTNVAPSSTSSTSLASTTPSPLVSLPLPLTHMGLYHQSHFTTQQRMSGLHPSPASTPSSQMSVGANLPSNLSSQGGRSPLEQEDLRCFSPLRN